MDIRSFLPRCFAPARRFFFAAQEGQVAIIFALVLIPLIGFVGAAIDYSRANSVKADLQAAVDSTALMVSKKAAALDSGALQSLAQNYFNAMFTRAEANNVSIGASYSSAGGSHVVITANASVATEFMRILGVDTIGISASSTARWGSNRLRVALVLDTTGSMADDGKIAALKTATKNLLTQLQSAASIDGDVYVSIIPFAKNVNADSSNYNASWIDWTDWAGEPQILNTARGGSKPSNWDQITGGSTCPFTNSSYGFTCTSGPANGAPSVSTIPSIGSYAGYICPSKDSGYKDANKIGIYYNGCYNSVPTTTTTTTTVCTGRTCSCGSLSNCSCTGSGSNKVCKQTTTTTGAPYTHTWIANAHSTWNGCLTDRGSYSGPVSDYDRLTTAPTAGIAASLFPAEQNFYCPPAMTGLNYNWTTMSSQVDALTAQGATNQPIGLVWGWQSLVGGGPLTAPAKDSNYNYTDVIILLSDGLNTLNRWYGNGSSTSTQVDARMYDSNGNGTCANIKAANITLYTIQVNTGGDPTSTLLRNCASSSDKFFLLTSANQIITTFDKIGSDLTQLRIAQ
ncbi:MAG TPA: pilus assembly protein [Pseudolabrys sp.]|nr:pilus assembly protein [Pseudolabrys sp.]